MAGVLIEISGAKELRRKIDSILQLQAVKAVVKDHTARLQTMAKRKAVFTRGYSTGHLRRTIDLSLQDGGLSGHVKASAGYSGYVEKGTRKMSAQPFMEPALEAIRADFIGDLKEVMK